VNAELAQQKMKSVLKDLLKKREHTYKDVAQVWKCSVPTVKRLLGKEELPVSRLLTMLEWLDLSLGDLEKLSQTENMESPRFTQKQTEFLAKNLREFAFLMELYDENTPQQIGKRFKLSPAVVEKILIQLEKYDLIRVGAAGTVKPFYSDTPRIEGVLASTTLRKQVDRMGQYLKTRIQLNIEHKQRGLKTAPGTYSWSISEVGEKTYEEFLERIRKELRDLSNQAKIDSRMAPKGSLKKAVISFGAQLEEPTSPHLEILTGIFDENLRGEPGSV
jgi:hypothetical protein